MFAYRRLGVRLFEYDRVIHHSKELVKGYVLMYNMTIRTTVCIREASEKYTKHKWKINECTINTWVYVSFKQKKYTENFEIICVLSNTETNLFLVFFDNLEDISIFSFLYCSYLTFKRSVYLIYIQKIYYHYISFLILT
jgi:hypothetical protein